MVHAAYGILKFLEKGPCLLFNAEIFDGCELGRAQRLGPFQPGKAFALEVTVNTGAVIAANLLRQFAAFDNERKTPAGTLESKGNRLETLWKDKGDEQEGGPIMDCGYGERATAQQEKGIKQNPAQEIQTDQQDPDCDARKYVVVGQTKTRGINAGERNEPEESSRSEQRKQNALHAEIKNRGTAGEKLIEVVALGTAAVYEKG